MMNAEGVFIGQVCHIEAAEPGGPRFNEKSNNEERRNVRNLMLMCHGHHKVTDDEEKYPTWKMSELKRQHELHFANPQRAILEGLKDWTKSAEYTHAKNLRKFNTVLKLNFSPEELENSVRELQEYVENFRRVPLETRNFLRAVVQRVFDMEKIGNVVSSDGESWAINLQDLKKALGLEDLELRRLMDELEMYRLGGPVELYDEYDRSYYGAQIYGLNSGLPIWHDLAKFCKIMQIKLGTFALDIDFEKLDL